MSKLPDEVLAVRVPPSLKRQVKKLADTERRTMSNLVEVLLSEALQARQSKEQAA
jgi:predicted transcriptional regulator